MKKNLMIIALSLLVLVTSNTFGQESQRRRTRIKPKVTKTINNKRTIQPIVVRRFGVDYSETVNVRRRPIRLKNKSVRSRISTKRKSKSYSPARSNSLFGGGYNYELGAKSDGKMSLNERTRLQHKQNKTGSWRAGQDIVGERRRKPTRKHGVKSKLTKIKPN